jgi:hypothetical protein
VSANVGAAPVPFSLRLIDAEQHTLVRSGLSSSSGAAQRTMLGPSLAYRMVAELLGESATFAPAEPEAEDVALVRSAFSVPREARRGVADHALAQRVGLRLPARDLLSVLEPHRLEHRLEPHGPLGVRRQNTGRARALAILELIRRTGWDARNDENGQPRPMHELAADYLAQCTAALAQSELARSESAQSE